MKKKKRIEKYYGFIEFTWQVHDTWKPWGHMKAASLSIQTWCFVCTRVLWSLSNATSGFNYLTDNSSFSSGYILIAPLIFFFSYNKYIHLLFYMSQHINQKLLPYLHTHHLSFFITHIHLGKYLCLVHSPVIDALDMFLIMIF